MASTFGEIRAHDIVKAFGRTLAIAGVDVTLPEGTITTIEGANGSGKSTLLLILALLMRPTRGEVLVNGRVPVRRAATRGRIGLVAHFPAAYLDLTARENLLLAANLCRVTDARGKIDALVDRFKMADFCDRPMRTYSRGQQQRTSLARAILSEPSLLLLDEPTTGLDESGAHELDSVLQEQRERGAIIAIATHNQQWAKRIADRRVQLDAGKVVEGEHGIVLDAAWAIAMKDLRIELRTKEILTTTGLFALLLVVLGSLAFYTDPVNAPRVAPGLLWLAVLFSGVLLMGRSWAKEREGDALTGLLLTPMPPSALYLGKTASSLIMLCLIEVVLVPILAVFFHLDVSSYAGELALLMLLGTLGFVATGTLFAAMSVRTRARDLMLSIVIFPLVAPALLSAAVATREVFAGATLDETMGWIKILLAIDLIAVFAGTVLFETLIDG